MRFRGFGDWSVRLLLLVAIALFTTAIAFAADDDDDDDETEGMAGIAIDAQGVLRTTVFRDPSGAVMRERIASAKTTLDPKLTAYSKLRKVSLNRLEKAILAHQSTLSDDMRYLAGLQRVRYVFYYPESKDIVLAGPAEGWVVDPANRVVGLTTGRPVVQLQDLIAALRAFPANGKPTSMIGCSIDPTSEGLAAMQHYLKVNYPNPSEPGPFVEGLRNSLGYQLVSISGVSPKTHFAQVLVEADYRMKLIGIGLERTAVKMASYVERAKPSEVSRDGMQRWFFVPDYKSVRQTEDQNAIELVGDGVKLVGEDEVVLSSGERRSSAGRANKASLSFVNNFTKHYPELAEHSPIYAELRNLIDMTIVAAYLQEYDFYGKADWKMDFFGNESEFPIETYDIPKTVATAVNAVWKGQTLMTPVGGGVQIEARQAIDSNNMLSDEKAKVSKLRESLKPELAEGQWWWD